MAARDRDIDRIEEPDVEIGAAARAKKLRFKRGPETEVKAHGESHIDERLADEIDEIDRAAEIETASGSERHNLPEEVEPGETYRDVQVGWRAAAKIRLKKARKRREG